MSDVTKNGCRIVNGKLIIKSGMQAEIPIIQILWIEPHPDHYNPQIIIKTVAGITIKFCVDPESKIQLKNLIQAEQVRLFKT